MFADIVFPNDNEGEFIKLAERLSIPSICFVYIFNRKDNQKARAEKLAKLQKETKLRLFLGLWVKKTETMQARKFADLILVKSTPENREVLEKREVDTLFGLEDNPKPDPMHYRYSSLNQVLCAIASQNRTIISFPFRMCLLADSERRMTLFGRISQNIRFCRKYKVPTALASFAQDPYEMRNPNDLASLGIVLGMTPGDSKNAIDSVFKRIEENQKIRDGRLIAEGIEFVD